MGLLQFSFFINCRFMKPLLWENTSTHQNEGFIIGNFCRFWGCQKPLPYLGIILRFNYYYFFCLPRWSYILEWRGRAYGNNNISRAFENNIKEVHLKTSILEFSKEPLNIVFLKALVILVPLKGTWSIIIFIGT